MAKTYSLISASVIVVPSVSIRMLVVDDFQPFRAFVYSVFSQAPELHVVGEASDGFEAVQKADELKPDLILLDIGLPKLNGIEAARQIRKLVPSSKILFLSQESSPDVVQEAISLGAMGYVVKAHAGSELLAAVEAVRQGRRFVSSGISGLDFECSTDEHSLDCRADKDVRGSGYATSAAIK
jgi:DNA-binding NarL/FixJ family response regulator